MKKAKTAVSGSPCPFPVHSVPLTTSPSGTKPGTFQGALEVPPSHLSPNLSSANYPELRSSVHLLLPKPMTCVGTWNLCAWVHQEVETALPLCSSRVSSNLGQRFTRQGKAKKVGHIGPFEHKVATHWSLSSLTSTKRWWNIRGRIKVLNSTSQVSAWLYHLLAPDLGQLISPLWASEPPSNKWRRHPRLTYRSFTG